MRCDLVMTRVDGRCAHVVVVRIERLDANVELVTSRHGRGDAAGRRRDAAEIAEITAKITVVITAGIGAARRVRTGGVRRHFRGLLCVGVLVEAFLGDFLGDFLGVLGARAECVGERGARSAKHIGETVGRFALIRRTRRDHAEIEPAYLSRRDLHARRVASAVRVGVGGGSVRVDNRLFDGEGDDLGDRVENRQHLVRDVSSHAGVSCIPGKIHM